MLPPIVPLPLGPPSPRGAGAGNGDGERPPGAASRFLQQVNDFFGDAHLGMLRANKQVADTVEDIRQMNFGVDQGLQNYYSKISLGLEKAKVKVLDHSQSIRHEIFGNLGVIVRNSILSDPDMWGSVRSFFGSVIDELWAEIVAEVETNIEKEILRQKAETERSGSSGGRCYDRVRTFILHHFLPHDKTIFGKLQDPAYIVLLILTLIPVHGLRVALFSMLLFLLCVPAPPDEYQLLSFILLFKGNQFLTQGLLLTVMGAMEYFYCYSWRKEDLMLCIETNGPGSGSLPGQLLDYLGTVVLAWVAFRLLPHSTVAETARPVFVGRENWQAEEQAETRTKGGKMAALLRWDVACFAVSSFVLCALTMSTCWQHGARSTDQLRANLFWCRVLYAFGALPFWFFMIPLFLQVLTHSTPTGYNEHGACVPWETPVGGRPEPALLRAQSPRERRSGNGCLSGLALRRGSAAASRGALPGPPRTEDVFERVVGFDAFPGYNAESIAMKAETDEELQRCMSLCQSRGWGAFVVWKGNALFRSQPVLECCANLERAPASTVYLNWSAEVGSFEEHVDRDTFPHENAGNLRVPARDLEACLRLCRHGPARHGLAGPLEGGFGAMVVGRDGAAYFRRRPAAECAAGLVRSPGATVYINWAASAEARGGGASGSERAPSAEDRPAAEAGDLGCTAGAPAAPRDQGSAADAARPRGAAADGSAAAGSAAEAGRPRGAAAKEGSAAEGSGAPPAGPLLQWMWADSALGGSAQLHFLAELNPLRWSESGGPLEVAAQLEALADAERPVQVRLQGEARSLTFSNACLAAEWIRSGPLTGIGATAA